MLTYFDSGVLIFAAAGNPAAQTVLADPRRSFVTSEFLELEVIPKARYHRRAAEARFYETYSQNAAVRVDGSRKLSRQAFALATDYGPAAFDALHLAAALAAGADELITTEKPTKPLFRCVDIITVTNFPA